MAAFYGHIHIIRELVKADGKLEAIDDFGETALHKAAYYGHLETVEALLEAGAKVNPR